MTTIVTICPDCNSGNLVIQSVTLVGDRNGEEFSVTVPGLRCESCDYQTIANSQSGEFTRAVSDAYRSKHGLLTGYEIRELRNRLGMNQIQFAEYLNVGSSSVKRWESGQIQEKGMDELMRLKTEPARARSNYEALETRLADVHLCATVLFSGVMANLSICPEQKYYRSAPMKVDWSMSGFEVEDRSTDRELAAA
jgi:putative zinc finger/helix-turn-helix YgiT family protein